MFIPKEFKKDILVDSNYLRAGSAHHRKDLRNLFRSPINQKYLEGVLVQLLTDYKYINRVAVNLGLGGSSLTLAGIFKQNESEVRQFVDVFTHKLPAPEYLSSTNPIEQLSYTNTQFITDTSRTLIMNPSLVQEDYYYVDQYSGYRKESLGQSYSPASYSTGYWDPLEDVKSRPENMRAGYWRPRNITFDPNLPNRGPGHRYNSDGYNGYYGQRTDQKFSIKNINRRNYDRGDHGFREGGFSDRRVQQPSKYNMFDLMSKPSY